jgi:hypothetical protein
MPKKKIEIRHIQKFVSEKIFEHVLTKLFDRRYTGKVQSKIWGDPGQPVWQFRKSAYSKSVEYLCLSCGGSYLHYARRKADSFHLLK